MKITPVGSTWKEYKESRMTEQELNELALKADILCEIIEARQSLGISQKELEKLSGVKQPVIARLEKDVSDPQLMTLLKILKPLGKTLAVVDLNHKVPQCRP